MSLPQSDELKDPALVAEVDLARAAAQEEAGDEVGAHVETQIEGDAAVTHLFEANKPGYYGWRWAATVSSAGPNTDVTVSEVVLLPGPDALVAPDWVPWEHRVQAGDLGVGDLLPAAPDDYRLVPGYVASDDPAVESVALEVGLGRPRVMARPAREEAAARWQDSEFGPRADMARSAPAHCGTCGFYLQLAGSLGAAFGTCGNEYSPADAHIVHAEYGCGAHSEAEVEQVSPVLVANLIYDDAQLDVEPLPEPRAPEPEASVATADESTALETSADEATDIPAAESTALAEPGTTDPDATDAEATEANAEAATEVDSTISPAEVAEPEAAPSTDATATVEPAVVSEPEPVAEVPEATDVAGPSAGEAPESAPEGEPAAGEASEATEAPESSEAAEGVGQESAVDLPPNAEPAAPLEPLVSTETSVPDDDTADDDTKDDTKTVGWSGWRAWTAKRQEDDAAEPDA